MSASAELFLFAAQEPGGLDHALAQGRTGGGGPCRAAIVANSPAQLAERKAIARRHLETGTEPGPGVFLRRGPIGGDLALVFGGAGAAYAGMGGPLLDDLPQLKGEVAKAAPGLARGYASRWPGVNGPLRRLLACTYLCHLHFTLGERLLGLVPQAVLGYSSGEVTSLFAGGFWSDPDSYLTDCLASDIFTHEIAEPWSAVARAWRQEEVHWENWVVKAPVEQILEALEGESRAHLAVIHHDGEGILAGDRPSCERVRRRLGTGCCLRLEYDFAAHVPELVGIRDSWLALHRRPVQSRPGVRPYSAALASSYEPGVESCACNLLAQFDARLDFRKVVERAYADGVRVFVEHGPGGSCTRWIRAILGGREAVTVCFDRKGAGGEAALEAAAALWAAGVACNPARLTEALQGRWPGDGHVPTPPIADATLNIHVAPAILDGSALAQCFSAHTRLLTEQHLRFLETRAQAMERLMDWAAQAEGGEAPPAAFSQEQLVALAAGRPWDCFGPNWREAKAHVRTPRWAQGRPSTLVAVHRFEPGGGTWARGLLAWSADLPPEAREVPAADRTDPSWPGQRIHDAALEGLAFFLTALGHTIQRDGWCFEPAPETPLDLAWQGPAGPGPLQIQFQAVVEEVRERPEPTVMAEIRGDVAGRTVFKARRSGLRLVPGFPLEDGSPLLQSPEESGPVAEGGGVRFDFASLMAWALGRPSLGLGQAFRRFDCGERLPRVPSPPFLFMTRMRSVDGEMGCLRPGLNLEAEYDIPHDAWYFQSNGYPTMPFTVILDAALQSCGWLFNYLGITLASPEPLLFRVLEGSCTLHAEVDPRGGPLRTRIYNTALSRMANLSVARFRFEGVRDGARVISGETVLGVFPVATFRSSAALPVSSAQRAFFEAEGGTARNLAGATGRGRARLAESMLRMIDRVDLFEPDGGAAGLGRARAQKDVDPGEWFFRCHFFQDPVQPGSLGIEGMLQLLQWTMLELGLDEGMSAPRFQPLALGVPLAWKFAGQVVPGNHRVTTTLELTERGRDAQGAFARADASLWVDGRRIHEITSLSMRIVDEACTTLDPAAGLDREQLEAHSLGSLAELFGPAFQHLDRFRRRIRIPAPPLMLADRVIRMEAEPLSMLRGTIRSETKVRPGAWYLHAGRMPAGIMAECGQPVLVLLSYLGLDAENRGERVYRMLGCTLTFHGGLPQAGESLAFEVRVDGHATVGGIRLVFFSYDCRVDGRPRLTMAGGQAGFFTEEELAAPDGLLWRPEEQEIVASPSLDPPEVACSFQSFTREQVAAFAEGRPWDCFGPAWRETMAHTRTPRIPESRMRFIETVEKFAPRGGPWGRGYLACAWDVSPDAWFFQAHFPNDPCMPGTLMLEAGLQGMAFYLAAMGCTILRDGWRFEPVEGEPFQLKCRGQVAPTSRRMLVEIFVEEFRSGPEPVVHADILITVDGLRAFHGRRIGLRLVPGWPLDEGGAPAFDGEQEGDVAEAGGFRFGWSSVLAYALGRPSLAAGPAYARFDGPEFFPHFPAPPFLFMTRVLRANGRMGAMERGMSAEVAYEIPEDAWYFKESEEPAMPCAVLLEAAAQPCLWLANFMGCPLTTEETLRFRYLDGSSTFHAHVRPTGGPLKTRLRNVSLSRTRSIILVGFEVESWRDGILVYSGHPMFGYFPAEALQGQAGLPVDAGRRAFFEAAGMPARNDVQTRLGGSKLLMIDRVDLFEPEGGSAGLGRARSRKDVDPGEWFFRAHYFQDPVQPGSLGIEAMLQLLRWTMLELGMDEGMAAPRFEPLILGQPMTFRFRGQVLPRDQQITITLEISERGKDSQGAFALAEASLWIDGRRIYEVSGLSMRLVDAGCQGS